VLGRVEEARTLAARAIESSPRHPGFAAHALHLLGDIAAHPAQPDVESGEAHYSQALALAELRGMRPLVAHCRLGLGKLHRPGAEASEHLAAAAKLYRELGMRFWATEAETARQALG